MSKVKLLLDVVQDMRSLADSIQAVADAMTDGHTAPDPKTETAKTEAPTFTIEQVREVLAPLSQSGRSAEVRELLAKYGAHKLSEIDPSHYGSLIHDAEVL